MGPRRAGLNRGSSSGADALSRVLPATACRLTLFRTYAWQSARHPFGMAGRFHFRLALERVLDLLARVLEARLRLVDLALVLGAPVSGHLAQSFFRLAAYVVDLVACLV